MNLKRKMPPSSHIYTYGTLVLSWKRGHGIVQSVLQMTLLRIDGHILVCKNLVHSLLFQVPLGISALYRVCGNSWKLAKSFLPTSLFFFLQLYSLEKGFSFSSSPTLHRLNQRMPQNSSFAFFVVSGDPRQDTEEWKIVRLGYLSLQLPLKESPLAGSFLTKV